VSDPTGLFAQGIEVLKAGGEWMEELAAIMSEYGADRIVAGMPRRTDGSEGPEAARTRKIVDDLAYRFPEMAVSTWDERFTTVIANQALLEADVSRAGRKKKVDKIAAAVLLQSYLDSKRPAVEVPITADIPSKERAKERNRKRKGYE
jgi:putative Holliday junction resolvase